MQVNVGSAYLSFASCCLPAEQWNGALALKTFSFRGHGFFSELDVPWDMASIEYAWLMEIVVGSFTGSVHPAQVNHFILQSLYCKLVELEQ